MICRVTFHEGKEDTIVYIVILLFFHSQIVVPAASKCLDVGSWWISLKYSSQKVLGNCLEISGLGLRNFKVANPKKHANENKRLSYHGRAEITIIIEGRGR